MGQQQVRDEAEFRARSIYRHQFEHRHRPQPEQDESFPHPFIDVPGPRASIPAGIQYPTINLLGPLHTLDALTNPTEAERQANEEQRIRDHHTISLAGRLKAIGRMHGQNQAAAREAWQAPREPHASQSGPLDEYFDNLSIPHVHLGAGDGQSRHPTRMPQVTERKRAIERISEEDMIRYPSVVAGRQADKTVLEGEKLKQN